MKVRLDADTVASPVSALVTSRTTFPVGSEFKTTVNVSIVPDSATLVPPDSVTVNPAVSSSVVVTPALIVARPE